MIIRTRIFDLINGNYNNLSHLAQTMGISVSQIYRVRTGKRNINQKFITGAIKAFPQYKLDQLFYLAIETHSDTLKEPSVTAHRRRLEEKYNNSHSTTESS